MTGEIPGPAALAGAYRLERRIGSGRIGAIYLAQDERLGRTAEIELLETTPQDLAGLTGAVRALAGLHHPHVLVVYELGIMADGRRYIAREHVAGPTLAAWIAAPRRRRAEVVDAFVAAAAGLVAAHRAGIAHGAFTASSVRVAPDGAMKVGDFALAPAAEPAAAHAADAQAWCAALANALCGGHASAQLARLPARWRHVLVRGLAGDAPLAELIPAFTPRRHRAPIVVGGLAAAVVVGLATTVARAPATTPPCRGGVAEMAAVWHPARGARIAAAFRSQGTPGERAWELVAPRLAAHAERWQVAHRAACEASRTSSRQPEMVLDLRTACFERHRARFEALLAALERADETVIRNASTAASSLDALDECDDIARLQRRQAVPTDAATLARYTPLRQRLDALAARDDLGQLHAEDAALGQLLRDPALRTFADLDGEAQYIHAGVLIDAGALDEAERALFAALVRGQEARDDVLVAYAAVDLAHVVGYVAQRPEEGARWLAFTEGTKAALGARPRLGVRIDTVRAGILLREGKLAESEASARRALAKARQLAWSSDEGDLCELLAEILATRGGLEEAEVVGRRAVEVRAAQFGPAHPITATARMNHALTLAALGKRADTERILRAVVTDLEHAADASEVDLARALSNLGNLLVQDDRFAEARPLLGRALELRERALGPEDLLVAKASYSLGFLELAAGAHAAARPRFERADAIFVAQGGEPRAEHGQVLEGLARAHLGSRAWPHAMAVAERAMRVLDAPELPPSLAASAEALLAQLLWREGRDRTRARRHARHARPILVDAGETDAVAELDAVVPR